MAWEEEAWTVDEKLDIEQSNQWLKSGNIKGETESSIMAALDQAVSTNYFRTKILKEGIDIKCKHVAL
jgi:hypothetical protein